MKKKCAYCNEEKKLTKEHTVNKALIKKLDLNESPGYEHTYEKYTTNNSTIKDVCEKCNNGALSELDDYFLDFIDNNLPLQNKIVSGESILLDFNYNKLSRWLLKTLYNSERKNSYSGVEKKLEFYKNYILGKENLIRPLKVFIEILHDVPDEDLPVNLKGQLAFKSLLKMGNIAISHQGKIDYAKQLTIGNFMFYIFIESDEVKNDTLAHNLLEIYNEYGISDLNKNQQIVVSNRNIIDLLALTYQGKRLFVDMEDEIQRVTKSNI